jgi:hypothetical protein
MDAYCTSGNSPTKDSDSRRRINRSTHSSKTHGAKRNGAGATVLPAQPDLSFENHFSIFLIRPLSSAGQSWLDENVGNDETLTWGGAVVCEPRYVGPIYRGAIDAGLVCR